MGYAKRRFLRNDAALTTARSGEQQNEVSALNKQQTTTNNIASCGLLMIGCELSDEMIALKSGLAALSHNTASPNSNHGEQSHGRS